MDSSQFSDGQRHFESLEPLNAQGATCDTFRVKVYGKLHFLKRLKPEHANDIRYQEAFRKEFETGYRLEHPHLVRYISLSDDGILMEYVDGETLAQRLADRPDYFQNQKNADRFLRQLLDVVDYLHSHQVLHLDLKPDNILLTHIHDDVKLIDLGCCYTDTFTDTQGHTNRFAAPEQLSGERPDVRTDIYAIGRILELLPCHHIYNKVIARCTAEHPADRYQSVEALRKALNHWWRPFRVVLAVTFLVVIVGGAILIGRQNNVVPKSIENGEDTVVHQRHIAPQEPDSPKTIVSPIAAPTVSPPKPPVSSPKNSQHEMEREMDKMLDAAYRSTIVTFCDSVFPSLTVGRQWEKQTSEFHTHALQIAADLSRKYPNIPESVVIERVESRFQNLVSYVFNKMRQNGQQQKSHE